MRFGGVPTALLALAFLLPTRVEGAEPPALSEVVESGPSREIDASFAAEKRSSAMRAAALSFGARAGLARRGWEISRMLERHAPQLSSIFRFRDLLLTEGGFTVMPPVAAETRRAFRLGRDGAQAASAGRVVRILSDARFVSSPPGWRDYLVRRWAAAEAPVSVLFPRDRAEEGKWKAWIVEGWREGVDRDLGVGSCRENRRREDASEGEETVGAVERKGSTAPNGHGNKGNARLSRRAAGVWDPRPIPPREGYLSGSASR